MINKSIADGITMDVETSLVERKLLLGKTDNVDSDPVVKIVAPMANLTTYSKQNDGPHTQR